MNHTRFLYIVIPVILLPSLLALALTENIAFIYIKSLQALVLLAGVFLAWRISNSYLKELRKAFIFLALFLFIYAVSIITLNLLGLVFDFSSGILVVILQLATYAMLVLYCIYIMRVVDVRRLNKAGWLIAGIILLVCLWVALYPPLSQPVTNISYMFFYNIIIRFVDTVLITSLVPVIWLYVQYLKTQQQQSLTFTVIVSGIVVSTIFDYILQSIVSGFPNLISSDSNLYALITEIIYAYGFSIIAVGLYAHLKHDEWGFKMIEKALV